MSAKTPIRTVFNDSNVATGLAEFQTGEFIPLSHGGIGAALSIGSAGQVLKVNSGATALEFGSVEAIVNIDGATDLTSQTLVATDKLLVSDGGTEGRVNLSQLDTLFSGTTQTLTNKTLTTPVISSISNTGTITLPTSTDTLVGRATTDTLTNKTISGASNTLSNIGNSSLSNSTVTVGSTSINLGATSTTIAGITDFTAGSINIAGNVIKSTDSTVVEIGGGDGLSVAGNLTVAGNMTVSGTTTTLETTNSVISDKLIELANGTSGTPSGDVGIVGERGSSNNIFFGFDESADEFTVGTGTFTGASTGDLGITKGTFSSANNRIYNGSNYVQLSAPSLGGANVTLTLPSNDGDANQVLITDGSGNLSFTSVDAASGAGLSNVVEDSTPQLGGNLDVQTNSIVTTSNRNLSLLPNGNGKVYLDGDFSSGGVAVSDGLVEIKTGTGNVSKVLFYCETGNAHYQTLQAQPHSAASSAVLTLPAATGTLIGTGDTSTVTNAMIANSSITIQDDSSTQDSVNLGEVLVFEGGSGITTTVTDNKVSFATDGSIVTETSTDTLTNKTLTSAVLNGTISGTSIKDEDDMSSDSANHLATQQSIKAYVDSQVTAQDLDFQADSGGALSIDLDSETMTFTGGTGIDTTGSGNAVTFAIDSTVATLTGTQTFTNKTLTSPKINEDVAVTATATELNHMVGATSAIQTQLDNKAAKSFAIAQAVALG